MGQSRPHNSASRTKDDTSSAGFTLMEVIVALAILTMTMTGMTAGLITAIEVTRATADLNRAKQFAQKAIAQADNMAWNELGFYSTDGAPATVVPPAGLCRVALVSGACPAEPTVILAGSAPTYREGLRPSSNVTLDSGSPVLPSRAYTVVTSITTMPKRDVPAAVADTYQSRYKRILTTVSWTVKGKTKTFQSQRIREPGQQQDCGTVAKSLCVGYTITPSASSGVVGRPDYLPMTVGGTASAPTFTSSSGITFWLRPQETYNFGTGNWNSVVSAQIKLFNLTNGTMVNTGLFQADKSDTAALAGRRADRWTYNVPVNTNLNLPFNSSNYDTPYATVITVTWTDGTTSTVDVAVPMRIVDSTTPSLAAYSTTGEAFPTLAGTPTGALRTGTVNAATPPGTIVKRLCTKTDGSLWANQGFYFETVNFDYQDKDPNGSNKPLVYGRVFTSGSTSAARVDTAFAPTITSAPVSGSTVTGAPNRTRWAVSFPTGVGTGAHKFFMKAFSMTIIATRPSDGQVVTKNVNIPVYQSSVSSLTCESGTATQPTY